MARKEGRKAEEGKVGGISLRTRKVVKEEKEEDDEGGGGEGGKEKEEGGGDEGEEVNPSPSALNPKLQTLNPEP